MVFIITIESFSIIDFYGPDPIDKAIEKGLDLNGNRFPLRMLNLYREIMHKEGARQRKGVKKSMRNRILPSEGNILIKTLLISV